MTLSCFKANFTTTLFWGPRARARNLARMSTFGATAANMKTSETMRKAKMLGKKAKMVECEAMENQILIKKAKRQAEQKRLLTKLNRKSTVPKN